MNIFKKTLMMAMVLLLSTSSVAFAGKCSTCAEKIAIKDSIAAAMAAAMAASKPAGKSHDIDTLEDVAHDDGQPCCASCAEGGECEGTRCACSKPKPGRAERPTVGCDDPVLPNSCCKEVQMIYERLKKQGQADEKCCRQIRHDIDDVEDLVVSLIDSEAICCSVIEGLILSQITTQAICCSVIEANLGDACLSSVVNIPNFNPASIIDFLDTTCLDSLTLLKSILALVAQIFTCTCT